MKSKLLVLAVIAMLALGVFGTAGHVWAQGPTGTQERQSAVDTDNVQDESGDQVGEQVEDGKPDSAAVRAAAQDTDNIQDQTRDGQQIEDGLPDTGGSESGD